MVADKPIVERIAENLLAMLQGIQHNAGYFNTLQLVSRRAGQNTLNNLECCLVQFDPEPEEGASFGFQWWAVTFAVVVGVTNPEMFEGDPADTLLNRIWADVHKAVMADRQRGGLAHNTTVGPLSSDEGLIVIPFDVHFETQETNICQQ